MFYSGLVRKKNVLGVMMQCVFLIGLMTVIWALYGYSLAFGGLLPIGAILSGMVADQIGTRGSLVVFSIGSLTLGLITPRFGVPNLKDIESPEFSIDRVSAHRDQPTLEGGPVIVLNTWQIDEKDFRWRLFRSTSDPTRLTELMAIESWEEHVAQHERIDDSSVLLIKRAREFDVAGGPRTRHLIAVDVEHPPEFDELVAAHEEMHQTDGSIPDPDQSL